MPNLIAISVETDVAPSFHLKCLDVDRTPPDGWGIGYYPAGEPSASVLKEPAPRQGSIRGELVKAWDHLESSLFLLHVRKATWGANTDANTQPFHKSHAGRDWLMAHAGSLISRVELVGDRLFTPVGSTDTELIFCELLSRIAERRWKSLGECNLELLREWISEFNAHGGLTMVLTDGLDVCAYADRNGDGKLYMAELLPPHGQLVFGDEDLDVDLTRRGIKGSKGIVLATEALVSRTDRNYDFRPLAPGTLLVIRRGAVRARIAEPLGAGDGQKPERLLFTSGHLQIKEAPVRRYSIRHRTEYQYSVEVERSSHKLRLTPVHDRLQTVLSHSVTLSVDGEYGDYEDVFGNRVRRIVIDRPYTNLVIESLSEVEVRDGEPFTPRPLRAQAKLPLVWMPWQRHMLVPYLLPPELPETQLHELIEYAESFVDRNDGDVLDVLFDLNTSIRREYRYQQGTTTLVTTPFDVYTSRQGVCQDFANLFMCLARLLGIPARYRSGYIYCGADAKNQVQSEASHAWVEAYLPEVGWKGFDPTNGVVAQTEHVRVAAGRSYVDATPTTGTLFVGGGNETLLVEVKVEALG
jgi:transglutaminase-like putative cysteine protease/predicted glutamine amidotransferase